MAPVIELENLSVTLGTRRILNNLTASVKGRAIGLLGPNGSGKSTLINTLLGFYPPSSGTAKIFGKDIQLHTKRLMRQKRGVESFRPQPPFFVA